MERRGVAEAGSLLLLLVVQRLRPVGAGCSGWPGWRLAVASGGQS